MHMGVEWLVGSGMVGWGYGVLFVSKPVRRRTVLTMSTSPQALAASSASDRPNPRDAPVINTSRRPAISVVLWGWGVVLSNQRAPPSSRLRTYARRLTRVTVFAAAMSLV